MSETLILKSIFFFISFWSIGIILLWFRPRIEIFWKIIATLIFIFYIWFFFKEINSGLDAFLSGWQKSILIFLKEILIITSINLFFFWPLVLILIFYKADDMGAESLLKFLSIFTLFIWFVFIIYYYFSSGINEFLYKNFQ